MARVVQAEWLTNFPISKLGSLSFYRMAKSRWEIENRGFNDGKNRYGMEHICHHEPNSILIVWLLILLAGHRTPLSMRYLHRGDYGIRSAMELLTCLVDPGLRYPARSLDLCRADGWHSLRCSLTTRPLSRGVMTRWEFAVV